MVTKGRHGALALMLAITPVAGLAGGPVLALGGPGLGPVPLTPPVSAHLAGSALIGYRGTDGETTGTVVTVSPWRALFFRGGVEVTPRSRYGDVRLLWGVGFEEWRGNTFFAHVHDYGPVRPDEDFTFRHAEATVGYKLPLLCGGPVCLGESLFAGLPFTGGPFLGARATLTVARTWYLSGGFGWTVPDALPGEGDAPAWRLFYGLGRWDWRPGGLFVTYGDEVRLSRLRDWKQMDAADRQGRGVLSAGVSFSY